MRIHRSLWAATILVLAILAPAAGGQASRDEGLALLRAVDEIAVRPAWPGFRLSDWPIAIFDGTRTLLFRHPSPPSGFKPLSDRPGIFVYPGRYPAVAGNSTIDLVGIRTGTIVAMPGAAVYSGPSAGNSAVLACVEELFHVFWSRLHTNFRPNEMVRYAYPIKDPRNLQRMLAEDEALARALERTEPSQASPWVAVALKIRREREALLGADDLAFETGLEMMEGTANYVARTTVGLGPAETASRLRGRRPADQFRWRYYESGTAICLLLDRWQPDWKARIDKESTLTTVALLESAIARTDAKPAEFLPTEVSRFESAAAAAIEELSARQSRLRGELLGRSGPRIVVEMADGGEPLRVTRFDPINLLVLDEGEVAHPRYITLSNGAGKVEMVNPTYSRGSFAGIAALTRPAGRHPLGGGVRRLTVVGLTSTPKVDRYEGAVFVETEGIRIEFQNAVARTEGETLRIEVRKGRDGPQMTRHGTSR